MGLPFYVLHYGRRPPRPWREDLSTTFRIMNKKEREREGKKNMAEVSFALLCPSWALADFPSDCGINPTLPEFDCSRRWFFEPLFWLHMLRAQPILGDCFLSQPFQCPSFGCAGCMSDSTSKNPFQVPFNESLPMHIAQVLGITALRAGTSSGVYSEDNPAR